MEGEKNTILFTLVYKGIEYPVQTNRNQYYSLMTLIADYLPVTGFGLCSGMGSCGTCMINLKHSSLDAKLFTLACDIQINDDLANAIIIVPDETRY